MQRAVVTIYTTQVSNIKTSPTTFLPEQPVPGLKMLSPQYKLQRRAFEAALWGWPSKSFEDDLGSSTVERNYQEVLSQKGVQEDIMKK